MSAPESPLNCANCNFPLEDNFTYCPKCKQKLAWRYTSLKKFIADGLQKIFDYEFPIWRSLRYCYYPSKITTEYTHGKIATYYNPIKLYVGLLALIVYLYSSNLGDILNFTINNQQIEKSNINYFTDTRPQMLCVLNYKDSILREQQTTSTMEIADSLFLGKNLESFKKDTIYINVFNTKLNISDYDLITKTIDEICTLYHIQNFLPKYIIRQTKNFLNNTSNFSLEFVAKITWFGILIVPLAALLLWLLHFKRNIPYVDHIIFSLNIHIFTAVLLIFCYIIDSISYQPFIYGIAAIINGIVFVLAWSRIYPGRKKFLFLKILSFGILYNLFIILLFAVIIILQFIFF